jgi:hypothetical protein
MWSFHFLHPNGGQAVIHIHAKPLTNESVTCAISSHWWIDDQRTQSRRSLSTKSVSLDIVSPKDLVPRLEYSLNELLSFEPAALSSSSLLMPRKEDVSGNPLLSDFEKAQRLPT